jgi:hypothetical protein
VAVVLTGEVEFTDEMPKVLAKSIEWAEEAHQGRVTRVMVRLNPSETSPEQLRELKQGLLSHRGKCPVTIEFTDPRFKTQLTLPATVKVSGTPQMAQAINRIFGKTVVTLA